MPKVLEINPDDINPVVLSENVTVSDAENLCVTLPSGKQLELRKPYGIDCSRMVTSMRQGKSEDESLVNLFCFLIVGLDGKKRGDFDEPLVTLEEVLYQWSFSDYAKILDTVTRFPDIDALLKAS